VPLLVDIPTAARLTGTTIGTIRRWTTEGLPFVRAGACGKKLIALTLLTCLAKHLVFGLY